MKKELIPASKEHEEIFRETWHLRPEFRGDPECEAAFEYAATTKLDMDEMNFVGAIIERR